MQIKNSSREKNFQSFGFQVFENPLCALESTLFQVLVIFLIQQQKNLISQKRNKKEYLLEHQSGLKMKRIKGNYLIFEDEKVNFVLLLSLKGFWFRSEKWLYKPL